MLVIWIALGIAGFSMLMFNTIDKEGEFNYSIIEIITAIISILLLGWGLLLLAYLALDKMEESWLMKLDNYLDKSKNETIKYLVEKRFKLPNLF